MGNKFLRSKKGQAALETTVAFVIIILLLGGITKMWFWINNQIVTRQQGYNASRQHAGIARDNYNFSETWPVQNYNSVYATPELSEDNVLLGGNNEPVFEGHPIEVGDM